MRQVDLDPIIIDIVKKSVRPAITATIEEIQDEVFSRTGYRPSASVVKYALNRNGISTKNKKRKWVWQHNPQKGDE